MAGLKLTDPLVVLFGAGASCGGLRDQPINADNVMRQLKLEQRFALTYRELATLTQRAVRIINRYSGLFRRTTWSTRMVGADDYRNVLLAVRAEVERREQEFRREMRGYRQRRRPRV